LQQCKKQALQLIITTVFFDNNQLRLSTLCNPNQQRWFDAAGEELRCVQLPTDMGPRMPC